MYRADLRAMIQSAECLRADCLHPKTGRQEPVEMMLRKLKTHIASGGNDDDSSSPYLIIDRLNALLHIVLFAYYSHHLRET